MQKVLLELLLLSSTALAVIGDGFIVLPVDKILTSVGSSNFPNRVPIFDLAEGVSKSVQQDLNNMIQPIFGNGVFTSSSKYESSSDEKGSSWKYEASYGYSYAGTTTTIVYNNGVATTYTSTISPATEQPTSVAAEAGSDASSISSGQQKSPSSTDGSQTTTAAAAASTGSGAPGKLPFNLTAIPTEFWRIIGLINTATPTGAPKSDTSPTAAPSSSAAASPTDAPSSSAAASSEATSATDAETSTPEESSAAETSAAEESSAPASSSSAEESAAESESESSESAGPTHKQTGAFFLNLNNAQTLYYATLKVGTPEQEVQVMVDTGSSDLWFISSSNSQCQSNGGSVDCSKYGTYDKLASSSWHDNNTDYSISYFDGDKATGTMGQDNITFAAGFSLENANFAVIDNTTSKIGVLGVGYPELEAVKPKYVNLPFAMKEQDLIAKVAYSLYLDSRHATQGYILFGGIDHAKYSGELKSFDIVQSNGKYVYSQIPLTAVVSSLNNYTGAYDAPTVNGTHPPKVGAAIYNGTDSFNGGVDLGSKPALLDSGTTYSYLPREQVESIVSLFGKVTYNQQGKAYDMPCWVGNDGNYLEFNFQNEQYIQVPLSELVISVGTDSKGVQQCVFGILPGSSSILGDNFMRSVYAVFDLEDNTISIAPAAFNDEHQIVPIE
ncbi:Candidapepsin-7 [Candida viswanathii]|uniref:candidapepsin n=1 Tax=Candida viswanathii TaxID=5486 RepID=A0A367Y4D0_9ASCO|nr:Candidapepsin-7 [Candida viswanathii]